MYYLVLSAFCFLLSAFCFALTTYCLLLTACCLLLTTCHLLLTTHSLDRGVVHAVQRAQGGASPLPMEGRAKVEYSTSTPTASMSAHCAHYYYYGSTYYGRYADSYLLTTYYGRYADFYERALLNGIVGNQDRRDPTKGTSYIYMLPLGGAVKKASCLTPLTPPPSLTPHSSAPPPRRGASRTSASLAAGGLSPSHSPS